MTLFEVSLPEMMVEPIKLSANEANKNNPIVWVNSDKFMRAWRMSIDSLNNVPEYDLWTNDKKQGIKKFVTDSLDGYAPVPRVNAEVRMYYKYRIFRLKWGQFSQPYIGFVNGRHRTIFMHAMGASQIPVQAVSNESAEVLKKICGVD